jgi:hypothetical protein
MQSHLRNRPKANAQRSTIMSNIATPQHQAPSRSDPAGLPARPWTPPRVVTLVLSIGALLIGAGMMTGAGVLTAADNHWRDGDYLTTNSTALSTAGHALAVEDIDLDGLSGNWLGEARLRAASSDPDAALFVGVARTDDARQYLNGVQYSTVDEIDDPKTRYVEHDGGAPSVEPAASGIWVARTSGSGTQSLRWTPKRGEWTVVVMNSDGSSGVQVTADVGATVPLLERATWALLLVGIFLVLTGAGLIVLLVRRSVRATTRQA